METTLVLIKPGAVKRNLVGEITRRMEARGLQVVGLELVLASKETVEEHYAEHKGKPFFDGVVSSLSSAPIVKMAIKGPNAQKAVRTMFGATNPVDAAPGTVRGDLALTMEENVVHSSANLDDAAKELSIWFPKGVIG